MAGFFRSAWEQLGNLFGEDISPYPPGYERPGQKRKARGGRPGLQRRKARRLSQGRAEPQYTVPDYREADFYNGYARTSFHRDSLPGSFDLREGARYLETGSDTYLEEPRGQQGKGGRLSLSLTGARVEDIENETEDIKEKIDDLPVPEDTKEEVRQEVAQHILESPGSPGRAPRTPSARPQRPRSATPPPSRRMSGGRGRRASSADLNWTDFPNRTARQTLEGYDSNKTQAAIAIRDGLRQSDPARKSEPLYSLRDIEIRDGLWQLNDKLESFTMEHYNFDFGANGPGNKELLDTQLAKMPQATVDLIGCVASGGPSGPTGWRNLFFNKQKRRALVCAIIGEILEGQVLEHLFFGCSAEHEQNLERLQQEHAGDDGFDRKRILANYVDDELRAPHGRNSKGDYTLPEEFNAHVQAVVEALVGYLKEIDQLRPRNTLTVDDRPKRIDDLYRIVAHAGILSLFMRADPHTVYYMAPIFKEDDFKHEYMECFNDKEMLESNPHERGDRSVLDRALNQITIMKGVTTYRRGGWETGRSTPQDPEYVPGMAHRGIRTRILTHGWVYCRWGIPQRLDKGKPADRREAHGSQWQEPGFMKFRDVVELAAAARGRRGSTSRSAR